MNIITEIRNLWRQTYASRVTAGRGIVVEQTADGIRVSVRDGAGDTGGAFPWRGMFEIVRAEPEEADGDFLAVHVINGSDPLSSIAGVAHVDRQPFEMPATRLLIEADHSYVYIRFSAPVEETDLGPALPAQAEIMTSTGLLSSDDSVAYHLIGQVWYGDDGNLVIEQDHLPGNVYMEWYGPCLGLLEE